MSLKGKKPRFRSAYDEAVRHSFSTVGESLTDPQFAEDLKIQNMIQTYDVNNLLSTVDRSPQYVDFTHVTDLHSAMDKIRNAQEDFMSIPATIRERFGNDPKTFFQFASNSENFDELVDMGLATKTVVSSKEEPKESQPIVEKSQESASTDS